MTVSAIVVGAFWASLVLLWGLWRLLPGKKRCLTCQHFDLEAGQNAMLSQGPFFLASQHIPPALMHVKRTEDGKLAEEPKYPMWARWNQFGVCFHPKRVDENGDSTIGWGYDVCEHHKLVPPRELLRRLDNEKHLRRST